MLVRAKQVACRRTLPLPLGASKHKPVLNRFPPEVAGRKLPWGEAPRPAARHACAAPCLTPRCKYHVAQRYARVCVLSRPCPLTLASWVAHCLLLCRRRLADATSSSLTSSASSGGGIGAAHEQASQMFTKINDYLRKLARANRFMMSMQNLRYHWQSSSRRWVHTLRG
jgi:hypothetical protein